LRRTSVDRSSFRTAVERLGELDYPEYEILVIDNRPSSGVNDEVLAAIASLPRVRVLAERRPGTSVARNRGLWAATPARSSHSPTTTTRSIATGYACLEVGWRHLGSTRCAGLRSQWSSRLLRSCGSNNLGDRRAVAASRSGSNWPRPGQECSGENASRSYAIAEGEADTLASVYATGEYGTGCNMAFRTEVLRGLGGSDPALGGGTPTHAGEDCALFIRLLMSGGSVAYEPAAILHRGLRRDLDDLEKQMYTYGVGFMAALMSLIWEDPSHIIGLLRLLPTAVRSLVSPSSPRRVDRVQGYPFSLTKAELLGTLAGPFAYVLSRTQRRKWSPVSATRRDVSVVLRGRRVALVTIATSATAAPGSGDAPSSLRRVAGGARDR
jgi:hypothetical protein